MSSVRTPATKRDAAGAVFEAEKIKGAGITLPEALNDIGELTPFTK